MREFLQLSVRLMVFTLVAGLLLGLTNAVTEGPIKAQQQQQEDASRYAVFPDADGFEAVDDPQLIEKYPTLTAVYRALSGGELIGYTLNCAPAGYKGAIGLTIGVSADGAITGVIVDSQSETQGLGSRITEESFLGQFEGKAASSDQLEGEIDTITGATVSSSAVKRAVQLAATVAETELGVTPNAATPMDPEDEFRLNTLPGASGFESVDLLSFLGEYDTIRAIKAAYSGSEKIGYSFDLEVAGFGGDIALTLGIDVSGNITGLQVGENSETEGYGKAIEQSEYTSQYSGIPADSASLDAIDGISGATVTSTAVMRAVRQAVSFYDEFLSRPELPSLDGADEFIDITGRMEGREADYPHIVKVEQALAGGEVLGYRFTTSSSDGYNADVPIDMHVDIVQGRMAAISVISHGESEGIGTRAFESDYLNKFLGDFAAPSDGVDALSGATVTSSALKACVDECAAFYSAYISGEEAAA